MKKIILFVMLWGIISVNAMTYSGSNRLCIINESGNRTCLDSGDSYTFSEDGNYFLILEYPHQKADIVTGVQFFKTIILSLVMGIILLGGTYAIVRAFF